MKHKIKEYYIWHKWYAWRPVVIDSENQRHIVWLDNVWRMFCDEYGDEFTLYSLTKPNEKKNVL